MGASQFLEGISYVQFRLRNRLRLAPILSFKPEISNKSEPLTSTLIYLVEHDDESHTIRLGLVPSLGFLWQLTKMVHGHKINYG